VSPLDVARGPCRAGTTEMPESENGSSFGALLRQHRLDRGLTQEALAERAGLGARSIQHLERGEVRPQRLRPAAWRWPSLSLQNSAPHSRLAPSPTSGGKTPARGAAPPLLLA
jgi:DNA-binding XRE family transcriptional regulator